MREHEQRAKDLLFFALMLGDVYGMEEAESVVASLLYRLEQAETERDALKERVRELEFRMRIDKLECVQCGSKLEWRPAATFVVYDENDEGEYILSTQRGPYCERCCSSVKFDPPLVVFPGQQACWLRWPLPDERKLPDHLD